MLEYLTDLFNMRRTSERGASAVEYGLLVAGIAALVVAVVFLLGGVVKGAFNDTCATIQAKEASTAECAAPADPTT